MERFETLDVPENTGLDEVTVFIENFAIPATKSEARKLRSFWLGQACFYGFSVSFNFTLLT